MAALTSRSMTRPQWPQRKIRSTSGSLAFAVLHAEQVLDDGYHRSATTRVEPYQPVL